MILNSFTPSDKEVSLLQIVHEWDMVRDKTFTLSTSPVLSVLRKGTLRTYDHPLFLTFVVCEKYLHVRHRVSSHDCILSRPLTFCTYSSPTPPHPSIIYLTSPFRSNFSTVIHFWTSSVPSFDTRLSQISHNIFYRLRTGILRYA